MTSELEYMMNQLQGQRGIDGKASNIPQNQIEKFLASSLSGGRDYLNQTFGIPFVDTGLGLGDMFMGEAPEMFEDASWGAPYTKPTGHGRKLDSRVGDILGLPLPYAGGAKALQVGGKLGIKQLLKTLHPDKLIGSPLPEKGLVVAGRGADGKIYVGKKGDLHFNLPDTHHLDMGFIGPDGRYLTRQKALNRVNKETKGVASDTITGMNSYSENIRPGLEGIFLKDIDNIGVADPSKRKAAKMGLAGLGLAASPKIASKLMDLVPDTGAMARVAAPAAARIAATNPAAIKMANLLLSIAPRTVTKSADDLAQVFKKDGIEGLQDEINFNGQKIQFQDFEKGDVDPDELIKLLGQESDNTMLGMQRTFDHLTPKMEKSISGDIDGFVNHINHMKRDPDIQFYELNRDIADLLDQGYNPKDIWGLIADKVDIDSMPERIKKMIEVGQADISGRSDYIGALDQINSGRAWEMVPDLSDPAGRENLIGYRLIER